MFSKVELYHHDNGSSARQWKMEAKCGNGIPRQKGKKVKRGGETRYTAYFVLLVCTYVGIEVLSGGRVKMKETGGGELWRGGSQKEENRMSEGTEGPN